MAIFPRLLKSWIFWFILFLIIVRISFVFIFGNGFRNTIAEQVLNQNQTIARAEATNTQFFFEKFGNSIATVAQLDSIINHDKNSTSDLDVFLEQRRNFGFVGGAAVTDNRGVIKFNSNLLGTSDVGISVAERDFFDWAKNEGQKGEYFISKPIISKLGASKGQAIVTVISPVYKNNTFNGIVGASVILKPLFEKFFGMMEIISDKTEVYLVDEEGDLLFSNYIQDANGLNITHMFLDDKALAGNFAGIVGNKKEGRFQTEKHLVAYTPVDLKTQNWLLIVATHTKDLEKIEEPLRVRQMSLTILAVFTLIFFGVLLARRKQI